MSMDGTETGRFTLTPRLLLGGAIALLGVLLALDRFDLAVAAQLLRFWPTAIIAVGFAVFVQARKTGSGANGVVIMAVGAWILLNSLGIVRVRFWELFWPMVLMVIGTILVLQTLRSRANPAGGEGDDTLNVFAVLSGVKRASNSPRFRGGELTIFMGGGHIDLRQATIPRGEEAVIHIFAVMGGCEITAPTSWTIATPIVPVMGGVEDRRLPALPETSDLSKGLPPPRLVLRGLLLMGGVQIKS